MNLSRIPNNPEGWTPIKNVHFRSWSSLACDFDIQPNGWLCCGEHSASAPQTRSARPQPLAKHSRRNDPVTRIIPYGSYCNSSLRLSVVDRDIFVVTVVTDHVHRYMIGCHRTGRLLCHLVCASRMRIWKCIYQTSATASATEPGRLFICMPSRNVPF